MKQINVLFFGALSELAGKQEEKFVLTGGIVELLEIVKQKYPDVKSVNFTAAINQEIDSSKTELSDGDEVALLPPFTGG